MQPSVFFVAVLTVASPALADIAADFAPVPSGAMKEIGYYIPQRVELSTEKPESLTRAPADLSAPLYGEIAIGVAPGGAFHPTWMDWSWVRPEAVTAGGEYGVGDVERGDRRAGRQAHQVVAALARQAPEPAAFATSVAQSSCRPR